MSEETPNMNILGLHYGHDGAAAVIKDGRLVAAVSAERVMRQKKFAGVTDEVIDYVLKQAGLTFDDINMIALSDFMADNSHGTLEITHEEEDVLYTSNQIFGNNVVIAKATMRGKELPVFIISHHLSHAASAFYTSNYEEAMCFSMDSSFGHVWSNSIVAQGQGTKLVALESPGLMVGVGYAMFTELLGMGSALFKAGSTMGLASYGKPNRDVYDRIGELVEGSYFTEEQTHEDYIEFYHALWEKWTGSRDPFEYGAPITKQHMQVAASIQHLFEQCLLDVINNRMFEGENLCLAGGSLLNCNANSKIKKHTDFKNIHHFPACGDDGVAVGAALYVAHHIVGMPRQTYTARDLAYLGADQPSGEEPMYERIAELLADGLVVAWFNGRSEYGPRALGNRSILADPRSFHMREILNFVVKRREWFRPFAPVVLAEQAKDWFEDADPSPFMLYTTKVKHPKIIPAATHVDGTARHQTVDEETNPEYYRLIKAFSELTGVPVLINTSLNGNGAPILETEEDALEFFENSDVDALVLNGRLILK